MKDGNKYNINDLYEEFNEFLLIWAKQKMNISDKHLAQEFVNYSFINFIKYYDKKRSSVKTYLVTLLINRCKYYHVYESNRVKNIKFSDVEIFDKELEYIEDDYEDEIRDIENIKIIKDNMKFLKSKYRDALDLVYFQHMSYIEASEYMKVSFQDIKNYIFAGKRDLKKIIKNK